MCKVIAVANQKGGVGKTSVTVNLGIGLVRKGYKVLLIDADPQGSLSICLGLKEPDSIEYALPQILNGIMSDKEEIEMGIMKHVEGIDFVPSNIELANTEVALVNSMSREFVLKKYLAKVKTKYDYILIDCMPSLGMITVNALACSDAVLIPVQAAYSERKAILVQRKVEGL